VVEKWGVLHNEILWQKKNNKKHLIQKKMKIIMKINAVIWLVIFTNWLYGQSDITLKFNYVPLGSVLNGTAAYVEVENNAATISTIKPTKIVLKNVSFEDSLKLTIYGGNSLNNARTFTLFPKANEEYEINITNHWMIGPVAILTKGKQGIDSMALAKKFNLTSYVDEKKPNCKNKIIHINST